MKKKNKAFEENYFSGEKGTYSKCYEYKAENIESVYKERAVSFLKTNVPKKAKILDAACAFGDLLILLEKDKFQTYGIDVSNFAIKKAHQNTKSQLVVGDLNRKLPYEDNYFDAVFGLDIIEHLDSPYAFLKEIYRVVKKGGILFIQTPNINSIFERLFRRKWFAYQDETHLYFFTRKSLQFLLEKTNFKVLVNETIASPFPKSIRMLIRNTDIGGNLWLIARKI